jgi:hypothetical protein
LSESDPEISASVDITLTELITKPIKGWQKVPQYPRLLAVWKDCVEIIRHKEEFLLVILTIQSCRKR